MPFSEDDRALIQLFKGMVHEGY